LVSHARQKVHPSDVCQIPSSHRDRPPRISLSTFLFVPFCTFYLGTLGALGSVRIVVPSGSFFGKFAPDLASPRPRGTHSANFWAGSANTGVSSGVSGEVVAAGTGAGVVGSSGFFDLVVAGGAGAADVFLGLLPLPFAVLTTVFSGAFRRCMAGLPSARLPRSTATAANINSLL
jgi:hypothetical protein